jgi:hypothetical protein
MRAGWSASSEIVFNIRARCPQTVVAWRCALLRFMALFESARRFRFERHRRERGSVFSSGNGGSTVVTALAYGYRKASMSNLGVWFGDRRSVNSLAKASSFRGEIEH